LGWTSGTIGVFQPVENLEEKIRDFQTVRTEQYRKPFKLKSVVHLDTPQLELSGKSKLLSGIVHYEYVFTPRKLEEDDEGRYQLVEGEPLVDVRYGRFWLTTKSVVNIVVAEKMDTREFTFKVLSQAMAKNNNHCLAMHMDVNAIAKDYGKHWISGLVGRHGNLQSGTFYGDTLEREPLLRAEYGGWNKNQVGFTTDHFGPPTKVKVTREGTVTVYRGLDQNMGDYIRFVQSELLGYAKIATTGSTS
jgi:hypothetical protein